MIICHEHGCRDDATPGSSPPRCPAHALRRLGGGELRHASCPLGCNAYRDGEHCRRATQRKLPNGDMLFIPAPPGVCAMAGGPHADEWRAA